MFSKNLSQEKQENPKNIWFDMMDRLIEEQHLPTNDLETECQSANGEV